MQMPDPQQTTLPLRDIRLPAEPGFWPLAPGWWILLALLALLMIWLGILWVRYSRRKRRWQAINQQLSTIEFNYRQHHDKQQLLQQLSVFLRRFVKHQLHDHQAVSSSGDRWINALNQYLPGEPFKAYSQPLTSGVFQSACEYDEQQLLALTRQLIKTQVMRPGRAKAPEVSHV
ncbi:DUF4381 domain-containing protein [Marinicella sediminis]|uniref:DUF4381 domain-containing protein n=1 Tax=Marinicella sediminis TaxID=1792834 RepID=A0ABV7JGJ3_9GAMM|nr:DUF4381 domain-containing protein [Marinicella sediminis]